MGTTGKVLFILKKSKNTCLILKAQSKFLFMSLELTFDSRIGFQVLYKYTRTTPEQSWLCSGFFASFQASPQRRPFSPGRPVSPVCLAFLDSPCVPEQAFPRSPRLFSRPQSAGETALLSRALRRDAPNGCAAAVQRPLADHVPAERAKLVVEIRHLRVDLPPRRDDETAHRVSPEGRLSRRFGSLPDSFYDIECASSFAGVLGICGRGLSARRSIRRTASTCAIPLPQNPRKGFLDLGDGIELYSLKGAFGHALQPFGLALSPGRSPRFSPPVSPLPVRKLPCNSLQTPF